MEATARITVNIWVLVHVREDGLGTDCVGARPVGGDGDADLRVAGVIGVVVPRVAVLRARVRAARTWGETSVREGTNRICE